MPTVALLTATPSPSGIDPSGVAATVGKIVLWPIAVLGGLVLAFLLRWLFHRIIDRYFMRSVNNSLAHRIAATGVPVGVEDKEDLTRRLQQRARTVAGVLKSLATVVIFGVFVVVVLATLGVDIGPLLVSAGVVGIAIGFGAQSLVQDYLTGLFMLLEDQYAVGDYIDTGDAIGTVEEVGLRLTRLRDASGGVWYVPHGSIERVANLSQGYSLAIVDVPLSYGADVEAATAAVRVAIEALRNQPKWSASMSKEPPLIAVESMTSTAINLQVRQKTKPQIHLALGRALRAEILTALDDASIARPAVAGGHSFDPDLIDPAAGPT